MATKGSLEGAMRGCGVVLILLLTCVFVSGIFGLVYYFTTPEGEAVGTVSANGRTAVDVVAAPGETLHFTLSYSFPLAGFGVFDGPSRDNAINRALRASSLRVVATSGAGAPLETSCSPYNGRTGTVSEVFGTRTMSGALTDCVITVPSAGTYGVTGTVTWSPEVRASDVLIEVRKASAAR